MRPDGESLEAGMERNPTALTAERPYLILPQSTRSACAQAVFHDGTLSRVLELRRKPRG